MGDVVAAVAILAGGSVAAVALTYLVLARLVFVPLVRFSGRSGAQSPSRLVLIGVGALLVAFSAALLFAGMTGVASAFVVQLASDASLPSFMSNVSLPAQLIAFTLCAMCAWTFGVALERIYAIRQATTRAQLYAPRVEAYLLKGDVEDAIALSSSDEYRKTALAQVVLAGLQEYARQEERGKTADVGRDAVRTAVQQASADVKANLNRGVRTLATIGWAAPFVGLLGTVVGVVNALVAMLSSGSGGIEAVSAGIAEALVEASLGLLVAIPAVWFYNYVTGRLAYLNVENDKSSAELLGTLIRKGAT